MAPIPCGPRRCFVTFWQKACELSPTSGGNSPYKYCIPHS